MIAYLLGGPYDGDHGELNTDPVPQELWVMGCNHGRRNCATGGVHWYVMQLQPECVRYVLVKLDDGRGFARYQYGEQLDHGPQEGAEREREPVAA